MGPGVNLVSLRETLGRRDSWRGNPCRRLGEEILGTPKRGGGLEAAGARRPLVQGFSFSAVDDVLALDRLFSMIDCFL
jgi:hypothetical protein